MLRHLKTELRHATAWMAERIAPEGDGPPPRFADGESSPVRASISRLWEAACSGGVDPHERLLLAAEMLLILQEATAVDPKGRLIFRFAGREPWDPPSTTRRYDLRLAPGLVEATVEGLEGRVAIHPARDDRAVGHGS
jgi:hypothetical protein